MISEVNIRDWERSISVAKKALAEAADEGLNQKPYDFLSSFIDKVEAHFYMQQPQVAALFKEKK